MPKHMTIINLACTITKLRKWGQAWKYSAESAQNAASQLTAEHERKLTEHRAAFGARTEADAKIIAGLRVELNQVRNSLGIQAAKEANKVLGMVEGEGLRGAAERVVKERDGLQTQVQDMRAEMERLQMEVAALKSQTPKHPVKVGEWVRRTTGSDSGRMAQVKSIAVLQYDVQIDGYKAFWASSNCEPCDPPTEATHDTPEGKAAAEAAVKTEPVADDIKVGDLVEVFQSSSTWTFTDDVGKSGTITRIETDPVSRTEIVHLREHPDDAFALCDVRKVTT